MCVNTSNPAELLYPCDQSVRALDLKTGANSEVIDFTFDPRCLGTLGNYVAVGGLQELRNSRGHNPKGLFALYNRETGEMAYQDIGGLINNSITLYSDGEHDSELKAIVCNNDNKLYFLDLAYSSIQITQGMKFSAPLNHASISPNRKIVVACGDTQQIYLCPRDGDRTIYPGMGTGSTSSGVDTTSGSRWRLKETLSTWSDYGFSTGFHASGVVFGVAFQPGVVQLFDMRNLSEPLTQIYSTRPKDWSGAFRCLKFSSGPEDLLFVSEQMGRVHAIDLRNFENHQILMVPDQLSSVRTYSQPTEETGISSSNSNKSVINLYEDMLKSGEALPPVVNDTEVDQMLSDHGMVTVVGDFDEFSDFSRRSSAEDSSAIVEDDDTPTPNAAFTTEGWNGVTPNMRRASTSVLSPDSGIRDLRMDGVSLSNSRPIGLSGSPTAPSQYTGTQRSNSSSSGTGYNVQHLSRHLSRRMSQTTLINSLRYLASATSNVGTSNGAGHYNGYSTSMYRFDAGLHHHPPHHSPSIRASQTEHGVSGIAWTEHEGGKLVVGSDSGIGVWNVDGVARRTFPDYERR